MKGKSVAMKHFDTFCSTKGLGLNTTGIASAQRLSEEELCSEQLFREFATYTTEFSVRASGELFASGTATQYLSAAKEMAMRKFPRNVLWEERFLGRWYPSLLVAVEKKGNRRQIEDRRHIAESSKTYENHF